jgi:hypothetical protein
MIELTSITVFITSLSHVFLFKTHCHLGIAPFEGIAASTEKSK